MGRRRGVEELVRAREVTPVISSDPGRDVARLGSGAKLHRPRLLKDPISPSTTPLARFTSPIEGEVDAPSASGGGYSPHLSQSLKSPPSSTLPLKGGGS